MKISQQLKKMENQVITLHTETVIDSAHQLKGYDGKCKAIHGHSWKVEVWIKGYRYQLDKVGILFDFGKIKEIHELFDHKFINDIEIDGERIFDFVNPTAENLSSIIYMLLKNTYKNLFFIVRVYETKVGKETYCETGDSFNEC